MENKEFIEKYNNWNIKKQKINFLNSEDIYFKEGDIWWCSFGLNVGSESYGKGKDFRRPILVIKKLSENLCIVLPLTSKHKIGTWWFNILFNNENRYVMLYQIRTLNTKRFQRKIGEISIENLIKVKEKLESLLELSKNHHSTEVEIERVDGTSTLKDIDMISNL